MHCVNAILINASWLDTQTNTHNKKKKKICTSLPLARAKPPPSRRIMLHGIFCCVTFHVSKVGVWPLSCWGTIDHSHIYCIYLLAIVIYYTYTKYVCRFVFNILFNYLTRHQLGLCFTDLCQCSVFSSGTIVVV